MTRHERIAALQAQLDSSRKRRSALLDSLGKDGGADADAEAKNEDTSMSASLNLAAWLTSTPAPALVERSDLSPSPLCRDDAGTFSSNKLPWDSPIGVAHASPAGLADNDGRPAQPDLETGGDALLRATLRDRTKQLSDVQGKLAEATRKLEDARKQALEDKNMQTKLLTQNAERNTRIEVLEATIAQEKRNAEERQDKAAELRKQCDEHEAAARSLRMDIHQKTLQFDRIQNQGMRQQSEGEIEARRVLLQTKDELLAHKTEILELKSALNIRQKQEGELTSQIRHQEEVLEELRRKEAAMAESLRHSKVQISEHERNMERVKSEWQGKLDALDNRMQRDMALQVSKSNEMSRQLSDAERDMTEMSSGLHNANLKHDSDASVIASLKSELGALADLDESLRSAAARESEHCNHLKSQIVQLKEKIVISDQRCAQLQETHSAWQKEHRALKEDLNAAQESNRWLRDQLDQRNRELLEIAAKAKEPTELSRQLENLQAELSTVTDESRIAEAAHITYRAIVEADMQRTRQLLAEARIDAATLCTELVNYRHVHQEVTGEMQAVHESMHVEQLSLQRDLVVCMQEITRHDQTTRVMARARAEACAVAGELQQILVEQNLQQAAMDLQLDMRQQEHVTERLTNMLYASESARQILVQKVQKLELDLVEATDENMSLNSRIQELEMAKTKSARQLKFLESQLEVQQACLESAEAKIRSKDDEVQSHVAALASAAEQMISFRDQLETNHKVWCEQVDPLQKELEETRQNRDEALERLAGMTQEMELVSKQMHQLREVTNRVEPALQKVKNDEEELMKDRQKLERELEKLQQDKTQIEAEHQRLEEDREQLRSSQERARHLRMSLSQQETKLAREQEKLSLLGSSFHQECQSRENEIASKLPPADMEVTLDIDFGEAGEQGTSQRAEFQDALVADFVAAAGVPHAAFCIKNLSPGSIIVHARVLPGQLGSHDSASSVVSELERQAADPASSLRAGKLTSKVKGVVALTGTDGSRDIGADGSGVASEMGGQQRVLRASAGECCAVQSDEANMAGTSGEATCGKCDDSAREVEQLKSTQEATAHELAALQAEKSQLETRLKALAADGDEQHEANALLKSMLEAAVQDGAQLELVKAQVQEVCEKELNDLKKRLGAEQESMDELKAELENVKSQLAEAVGQNEKLQELFADLEGQRDRLRLQLEEAVEHDAEKQLRLDESIRLNADHAAELDSIRIALQEAEVLERSHGELIAANRLRENDLCEAQKENGKLSLALEVKEVEITDLTARVSDTLQQFQQVVAWAAKEKQELQDKLDKLEQMTVMEEATEAAALADEEELAARRKAEEAAAAAAAEKAAVGIRSHVQHLEKVSSDLENLYHQTAEINALKRDIADKDKCLFEMEEIIRDQFAASSQHADGLEDLLKLTSRLDSLLADSTFGFEKLSEDSKHAKLEAIKSTRAWQAERLERASVFQALRMLLVQDDDEHSMQMQADEMTAEDVHRLLSQIMGDRYEVVAQMEQAQRASTTLEQHLSDAAQGAAEQDKLLGDANIRIEQLELAMTSKEDAIRQLQDQAEQQQQKHEADLRSSQEEIQNVMMMSTVTSLQLNESTAAERAELQGAVEESAAKVAALEEKVAACEIACESLQTERDQALAGAAATNEACTKMQEELDELMHQKNDLATEWATSKALLRDAELRLETAQSDLQHHLSVSDKADELEQQLSEMQLVQAALEHAKESQTNCEQELEEMRTALNNELVLKARVELQVAEAVAQKEEAVAQKEALELQVAAATAQKAESMEQTKAAQKEVEEERQLNQPAGAKPAVDDAAWALSVEAQVGRLEKEIAAMTTVVQQLKANEGALTTRSVEAESKLAEAEHTMLACMAEEARLLDEIEAGEHREDMLEKRLRLLQGIRDPIHVPGDGTGD